MRKYHDYGVMERKLIEFNENNIIQARFFTNPRLTAVQKEILINMRKGSPNALAEADIVLPRDAEFLLQAVKYNPAALLIALIKTGNFQFFRGNTSFIKDAVNANWNVLLDCLSPLSREFESLFNELTKGKTEEARRELKIMLQNLRDLIKTADQEYAGYDEIRSALSVGGITSHPYRVKTYKEALYLMACQEMFASGALKWTDRLVIVVLYPRTDDKGFYDNNSLSRMIAEKDSTVLLFEIGHSWEMINIFKGLAAKLPAMQEICLIIGGFESANNVITFNKNTPDGTFNQTYFRDKNFVNALHKLNIRRVFLETYAGDTKVSLKGLLDKLAEYVWQNSPIYAPEVNEFAPEYWFYAGVPDSPMYVRDQSVWGKYFDSVKNIQYEAKKFIFRDREREFGSSRLQQEREENWRIYNELYRQSQPETVEFRWE